MDRGVPIENYDELLKYAKIKNVVLKWLQNVVFFCAVCDGLTEPHFKKRWLETTLIQQPSFEERMLCHFHKEKERDSRTHKYDR